MCVDFYSYSEKYRVPKNLTPLLSKILQPLMLLLQLFFRVCLPQVLQLVFVDSNYKPIFVCLYCRGTNSSRHSCATLSL